MSTSQNFKNAAGTPLVAKADKIQCAPLSGGWGSSLKTTLSGLIRAACPELYDDALKTVEETGGMYSKETEGAAARKVVNGLNAYVTAIYDDLARRGGDTYDVIAAGQLIINTVQQQERLPTAGEIGDFIQYTGASAVGVEKPFKVYTETVEEAAARVKKAEKYQEDKRRAEPMKVHMFFPIEPRLYDIPNHKMEIGYDVPQGFDQVFTGSVGYKAPVANLDELNAKVSGTIAEQGVQEVARTTRGMQRQPA